MSDSADTVTTRLIARVKHGAEEEWTLGGSIASSAGTLNTEKTLASYVKVTDGVRKVQMKSSFTESGFRPQVFSFNRCFSQGTSQADFFGGCGAINSLDRLLRSSNLGSEDSSQVDFCVLAYGQTGAGKTHTMFGAGPLTGPPINHSHIDAAVEENYDTEIQEKDPHSQPEDGLIVRSIEYLFLQLLHTSSVVHNFHLKLSCLEICDDIVLDLFSGSNLPVHIKENVSEGYSVSGCQFIDCTSFESAAAAIELVARHRRGRYAPNSLHSPLKDSDIHHGVHKVDRSHCIVEVCVCVPMLVGDGAFSEFNSGIATPANELADNGMNGAYLHNGPASPRFITRAKVTFVDLAGSERLRSEPKVDTKSTNKPASEASAKESRAINPSLYVLGKVIAGLVRAKGDIYADDVPFHESVLTKLLIQPLSRGNILRSNLFIACIDDSPRCEYETLRTLKFATSCVQLRSRAALGLPKMSKQDKLISELKLSIKKVKEDNQEMRRTILATPSYGDKILAHCDEDTLESSAAFANAPPKMKPKIKDVKKPVSLSEKKRTWASWKLFESNSKAKTAVINVHQNHLPIANLLTSGSRVYPMAGPTLNGQFPAHNMSQSTVRGGSPLRSTTAPQGSTAEDEDFGLGFYNDEEREEMLLKKLADGMSASAQSKPRPSSSPNEKTSFQPSALFGSVTMSNVSGVSGGESHMDRGSHFSKTGPLPRGKSARPGQPTSGVESRGHGHSQEQTAKYENHMAEKRMAAQMKKRVLDECRKKNHQPISPYLGHFVPKRVIHDRPTFEVPLLHDIVPLHASIHQDEPMSEEEAHKLKGASTSGELRDGSHSRTHTPSKTHSGGKSRSASRSPSRSRPGSTHKKRTAHGSPGSAERPGSRGRRGLSGKIRSPEVMALEKAIQPHSMMFDLLDAEYRHFGRDDDEIANNPSSLVDRILPTTAEKAVLENHSFSPRVEPLDLSVSGTGLSPQQKMALKEEKPVEAEVEEDADYDSYDEQFEAEEEPVEVPAVQVETAPEAPAEKVQAEDDVAKPETLTMSEGSAVEAPPVVTWSPSTKNKNDETPRSLSPTASIESETSKSPSHSSYPLPTTVILAQAQQGIHIIAEPSTPGFLSPSGRSQKAAHYAPQPASPVITSPKEVKHTWENEAVLLMAPVFAASEERQMEERQESFIQRMTMSSKGGFSDSVSSRDAFIPRVSSHDEEEENYEDEKYEFDAEDEEEPAPAESVVAGIALQDESPAPAVEQEKEPAAATDDGHEKEVEPSAEPPVVETSPLEASVEADATPAPAVEPAPTQDSYEDYDEEFEDDEATSRKESETALPEAEPVESSSIEGAVEAEPAVDPSSEGDEAVVDSAPVTSEGPDTESTDVPAVPAGETAEEGTAALGEMLADTVATEEKEEVSLPTVESPAAVPAEEEQEDEYEMEFNEDDEETQPVAHVPDATKPEVATSEEETAEAPAEGPAAVDFTELEEVAVVAPIATDESQAADDVPSKDEPVPVEEPSEQEPAVVESAPVEPETASNKYEEDAYQEEFEEEVEAEADTQASADAVLAEVPAEVSADASAEAPVDVDETSVAAAVPDDATESQEERVPDVVEETTVRAKPALVPPPANFEAFASEFSAGAVNRAVARIASRDDAPPAVVAQDVLTAEVLASSAVAEVLSRFTPREPEPEPATEQNVIDVLDLPLSPVHMLGDIDPVHHISATTMSEPFHLLDDFSEYDISWEMSPSPDAKGHGIAESGAESVKVSGAAQRPVTDAVEPASSEEHGVVDALNDDVPVVSEASEAAEVAEVVTEDVKSIDTEEPAVPAVSVGTDVDVQAEETPASEPMPAFTTGSRVLCNYHASGDWYAGVVASTNTDGTHNIDYDDGDKETNVSADMIRLETAEAEVDSADSTSQSTVFVVGAKVDANYRGKGRWYSGTVSRVRETGTYDIDYDDGEKETHVEADLLRAVIPFTREDTATALFMDDLLVLQKEQEAESVDEQPKIAVAVETAVAVDTPARSEPELAVEVVQEEPSQAATSLVAGVRVEGNYRSSGVWYPGVLARVHADGSGDINYDDGEVEAYVPAGLIRAELAKETTAVEEESDVVSRVDVAPTVATDSPSFMVGERVEAKYHGKKRWYAGVISQVHASNTFDIDYDDGEKEIGVIAENIRSAIVAVEEDPAVTELMDELVGELGVPSPVAVPSALQAGARVEGNYRASGVWYPGVLARVHADGSGDINYDDGEVEAYVPAGLIRAEETAAIIPADLTPEPILEAAVEPSVEVAVLGTADPVITGPTFSVGSRVEGNYRGKGRWYPGTVSRVRDAGTYDIDYDGGEKETHVVEEELIPLGAVVSTKVATPALQPGTRVEGNYRASGVWYPGVLARVHVDGSGDINYDDGEVEAYVPAGLIRVEVTTVVSGDVAPEAMAGEPSAIERTEEEEAPAHAEDTAEPGPAVGEDESAPQEQSDSNVVEEKVDPEPTVSLEDMPVVEAAVEPAPEADANEPAETVVSSEEEDLAVEPGVLVTPEDEEIAPPSEVPSVALVEGDTQAAVEPEHVVEAVSSEAAADGEIAVGETAESVAEPVADAGAEGAEPVQGAPEEEGQRNEVEAVVEDAGAPAAITEPAPVVERSVPVDEPSSDAVDEAAVDALVAITAEPSPEASVQDDEEVITVPVAEECVVESEPQPGDLLAAVDESTSLPAVGDVDAVNTDEPSTTELVAEAVKAVESELVETRDDVAAPADTSDTTDAEPASGAAVETSVESVAERASDGTAAEAAEKEVQLSSDYGAAVEENVDGRPDAAQAEESEGDVEETLAGPGEQEATVQPTEDVANEETRSEEDHLATEISEVAEPGTANTETVAAVQDPSSVVKVDEEAVEEAAPAAPIPLEDAPATVDSAVEEELAPVAVAEYEEPAMTRDENENDASEASVAPVQPSDDIADVREEEPPGLQPEPVMEGVVVAGDVVESSEVVDEPLSVDPVGQDAGGEVNNAVEEAADGPSSAEESPSTEPVAEADSIAAEAAAVAEEPSSKAGEQTGLSDSVEQPDTISDVPVLQGDAGDSTAEETVDTLEPIEETQKVIDESDLGDSAAAQEDAVVEEVIVDSSAPVISSSAPTEPVGEAVEPVMADAVTEVPDDSAEAAVDVVDEQLATEAEATETVAAVAESEHVAAEPVAVVVAEAAVNEETADPSGGVTVLVADPVLPEPEPAAPRVIEKGSRIEGNYRGKGAWIPGQVVRMHNNGSADINYQNGEMEAFVPPAWMRLAEEEKVVPEPVEQPAAVDASVLEQPEDTPAIDDAVEVAPVGADPSEEEVLEVFAPVEPAAVDVAELVVDNAPSEGFLPAGETAAVNEEPVSPTEGAATAQQGETEESVREEPAVEQAESIEKVTPAEVKEPTEDAVAPLAQSTDGVMIVLSQVDAAPVVVESSVVNAALAESAEPAVNVSVDNDNQVVQKAVVAAEEPVVGEESLAEAVGSTEMDVVLSQPAETTMPAETAGGAPAESEKESTVEEGVPLAEVGAAEANAHNVAATVEVAEAVSAEDAVEVLAEETPAVEVEPAVAVEENKIEIVDVEETTPLVESAEQPTSEKHAEYNEDAPAVVEESVEQTEPEPEVHDIEVQNASVPIVEAEPEAATRAAPQEVEEGGVPVEEDAPVESVVQEEESATDAEAVEQVELSAVDAPPTNAAASEELAQLAGAPKASTDRPLDTTGEGPVDTVEVAELSVPEASTESSSASQPIEEPEVSPVSVEDSPDPIPSDNVTTATKAESTGMSKKLAPQLSENLFEVDFSELGSVKQPPNTTALNKTDNSEPALSSAELAALALSVGSADEGDAQASEAQNDTDSVELKQEVNRASAESRSRKSTKSGKSAGDDDEGLFDVDFE